MARKGGEGSKMAILSMLKAMSVQTATLGQFFVQFWSPSVDGRSVRVYELEGDDASFESLRTALRKAHWNLVPIRSVNDPAEDVQRRAPRNHFRALRDWAPEHLFARWVKRSS